MVLHLVGLASDAVLLVGSMIGRDRIILVNQPIHQSIPFHLLLTDIKREGACDAEGGGAINAAPHAHAAKEG